MTDLEDFIHAMIVRILNDLPYQQPAPALPPVLEDVEIVYAIPGPPPTERRVTTVCKGECPVDRPHSHTWVRVLNEWRLVVASAADTHAMVAMRFDRLSWSGLLSLVGSVTLVPLTPEEEASETLYGPLGARWGSIGVPCTYYPCALWTGHIGPHTARDGQHLAQTTLTGTGILATGVTPAEAAERPCTCGHPESHQPDCARHVGPTRCPVIDALSGLRCVQDAGHGSDPWHIFDTTEGDTL